MDAGKFRTALESRVFHYDGVNTQEEKDAYTEVFLFDVTEMELPWELKDTPAEQFLSDAIALAKTENAAHAPKVRDLLERILQYMAAEGIPRRVAAK